MGNVILLAYINEKGGLDDVKVIKGLGSDCDEAATQAVQSCKFNPGMNNGIPIKTKLALKIVFEG